MIEVKAPITGWHRVTKEQAFAFAVSRYRYMTASNPMAIINSKVRGIEFNEQEIKGYILNQRTTQRRSQNIE